MKTLRTIVLSLLLPLGVVSAGGRKSVAIIPMEGREVSILISGKEKEYYLLGPEKPVRLQVDGPGKLTVISRLKLPKQNADFEKYAIRVLEGKETRKVHSTQTNVSDAAFKSSDDTPGKSRKFSLNIPEGSFTYEFRLEDTQHEAAVRFLLEPAKVKNLIAIEPVSYDKIVTARVGENLVAYYVASKKEPVRFHVVGPTRVQVSVRLNYDERMKGEQKYSLVVSENSKPLVQKMLHTTKSVGLSYEDWKEVVPGKLNTVSIDVPAGEHVYNIALGETFAQSVALKFSIPQKDLMNEK